jgi:hypothetical protein
MSLADTSPESQKVLIDILRNMSSAQKGDLVFGALRMGRDIAFAGLRYRFPNATDEQIRLLYAKQNLGNQLFKEVYGDKSDDLP